MGGNKGKVKPIDGRKWLQAYRGEIEWGEPHQWRLEELAFIKLELQTFFADAEKNQIPGKKLKQIKNARSQMPKSPYSSGLIKKMEGELDAMEIQVYQYLLPPANYSAVTQNFSIVKSGKQWKPNMTNVFLWNLRQEFSALPDGTKGLKTPIGKPLVAGVKQTNGASWKSATVVGAYIANIYSLLNHFMNLQDADITKRELYQRKDDSRFHWQKILPNFSDRNFQHS